MKQGQICCAIILIFLGIFRLHTAFAQEDLLIDNCFWLDVEQGQFIQGDILVRRGLIHEVGDVEVSPTTRQLDAAGKYVIPGLIDAHIHLFQSGGLYTRPDAIDLRKYWSYEKERQWLLTHSEDLLRRYLQCGITSVMDVGGPLTNYQIRDQQMGNLATPGLYVTGPLVSTYQPPEFRIEDAPIIKVHSAEEAEELVRSQIPYRPDFIKIWYIALPGQNAESTYDIVAATIAESHRHNLRVAVHATQLNTAKLALRAGADILVHSVNDHEVDDDFITLLKQNEAVYIPTLLVSGNYGKAFLQTLPYTEADFIYAHPIPLGSISDLIHLEDGKLLADMRENELAYAAQQEVRANTQQRNLKLLADANCRIATGTDAGNIGTFHASSYFSELRSMQQAGLSNAEVLRYSTLGGAQALAKEDSLGSINRGKYADLIILDADPLMNLDHLLRINSVVHNGHLIDPDTLVEITPETLVQQQLNAYNARDLEAFLKPYSENIELYDFPDRMWAKGKDEMRSRYHQLFENTPKLHCRLVDRMILGNRVIDQEYVTGFEEGRVIEAIAIYEIENEKISKVYFLR